jgi:hypothetical protein
MGRVATSELSHAQCVSIRKVLSSNSTSDAIGAAFLDVTRVIRDAGGSESPDRTACRDVVSRNVALLAQSGHSDPATSTTTSTMKSKWYPDHAVLSGATKDSLKNMAEFKYD